MAATPKNGTMVFRGRSGKTYNWNVYVSDVAAAYVTMSKTGAAVAGSQNFFIAPEDIKLVDFSIVTGTQDTTTLSCQRNDVGTGDILPYATNLTTIATRPSPGVVWQRGDKITFVQG